MSGSSRGRIWRRVRLIWATLGITATVIFAAWSIIAYRANGDARAALRSDSEVTVSPVGDLWRFDPVGPAADVGLLFVPGALPAGTRWVRLDGGNHSQFGWYGFQPGDRRATISAVEQRRRTIESVLDALRTIATPAGSDVRPPQ